MLKFINRSTLSRLNLKFKNQLRTMWNPEFIEDQGFSSDTSSVYYGESNWMFSKNGEDSQIKNMDVFEDEGISVMRNSNRKKKNVVVIMRHPRSFALTGKCGLKVLWGTLFVYGSVIHTDHSRSLRLLSPISNALLKITPLECEQPTLPQAKTVHDLLVQQYEYDENDAQEVVDCMLANSAGVLLQEENSNSIKYLEKFHPNLFRSRYNQHGIPIVMLPLTNKCEIFNPNTVPTIRCDNWCGVSDNIKKYTQKIQFQPRILICGGKGVGKSTMFRFLINSLLNDQSKVCCIDGDPGQSEFTPPGMISLVTVTEPCLAPGFAYHKVPEKAIFIGNSSPADHLAHYISSFQTLLSLYEESYNHLPLLINTMGWNRGIGVAILSDIIHVAQPTHVIQLDSKKSVARNFPKLVPERVKQMPGWKFQLPTIPHPYYHKIIKSTVDFDKIQLASMKSREVNLTSYLCDFQRNFDSWQPLNLLPFHKVPWSSVGLYVQGGYMNLKDILYVFNSSLVALCRCNPSELISSEDSELPKFLASMPVCHCLGYGLVRGISMEEKCFYIITSLNAETLNSVNAVIKGSIDIPLKLLLNQSVRIDEGEEGKRYLPYVVRRKSTLASRTIGQKCVPQRSFKVKK